MFLGEAAFASADIFSQMKAFISFIISERAWGLALAGESMSALPLGDGVGVGYPLRCNGLISPPSVDWPVPEPFLRGMTAGKSSHPVELGIGRSGGLRSWVVALVVKKLTAAAAEAPHGCDWTNRDAGGVLVSINATCCYKKIIWRSVSRWLYASKACVWDIQVVQGHLLKPLVRKIKDGDLIARFGPAPLLRTRHRVSRLLFAAC